MSWRWWRRDSAQAEDAEGVEGSDEPSKPVDMLSAELDTLFGPSRKHVYERKEWVAVAKVDDREAGAGPIDLDSGVALIRPTRDPAS